MYRSHLLTLFTESRSCNQHCKGEVAKQIGTLNQSAIIVDIYGNETASHSSRMQQPFYLVVYAYQITAPSKMFTSGMYCGEDISSSPTKYLAPSILHVWKQSQQALLSKCKSPVVIGADGRADSPGHSAKFGSYGKIDISTNKALHIELVQVTIIHYPSAITVILHDCLLICRVTK